MKVCGVLKGERLDTVVSRKEKAELLLRVSPQLTLPAEPPNNLLFFWCYSRILNEKQNWYLRVFSGFVSAGFLPFEAKFQYHLALQWQLFIFYARSLGLLCWGNGNSLNGNKIKLLWPLGNQKPEKLAWSNRTYCELALIPPPALWAAHVDRMQASLGQWFMRWHIDLGKKHILSIITQLFHCDNCAQKVSKCSPVQVILPLSWDRCFLSPKKGIFRVIAAADFQNLPSSRAHLSLCSHMMFLPLTSSNLPSQDSLKTHVIRVSETCCWHLIFNCPAPAAISSDKVAQCSEVGRGGG